MPIYENKSRLNITSIPEEKMNEIISREAAIGIYHVGNGFGKTEGFEHYFEPKMTYRTFIDKLVKIGLLIQIR